MVPNFAVNLPYLEIYYCPLVCHLGPLRIKKEFSIYAMLDNDNDMQE